MKIIPVPVRSDNYAYLVIDETTKQAAAVDVFDVPKVESVAAQLGVRLTTLITTHHHQDHSGGNVAFASKYPDAPVYGGSDRIPALTQLVKDKDQFILGQNLLVRCLATPCHTQDSICYYVTDTSADASLPGVVFTGDTLFIGGNGRFFEGTGDQMHAALSYLGTLPDDTVTYVGHEYTAGNLAFARSVDPHNMALGRLEALVTANKVTTGHSTIADEKDWNVFMRLQSDAIRQATGTSASTPVGRVMDALRELKNNFRG